MARIETKVYDKVALEELTEGERLALAILHMDKEKALDRFEDEYEETHGKCFETMVCRGSIQSFSVVDRTDKSVELENGTVFGSELLARLLADADEVVVYAIAVHGYEELMEESGGDPILQMFYNAWGAGYSMNLHRWIKDRIQETAQEKGLYSGRGWTPGEYGLDIGLQRTLIDAIDPSLAGIEAQGAALKPVMSLCGLMGVSSNPAIETAGSDIPESSMA